MKQRNWPIAPIKSLLRKPFAKKRYVFIIFILILYFIAKYYVNLTPSPQDDDYPDSVLNAVVTLFADSSDDVA